MNAKAKHRTDRIREQFSGKKLVYKITEDLSEEISKNIIIGSMAESGYVLEIKDGLLTIHVNCDQYTKTQNRYAGGKKAKSQQKEHVLTECLYSDVLNMMTSMSNKEIIEKIHMKRSTFYRHLTAMLESDYYASLVDEIGEFSPENEKYKNLQFLRERIGDLNF